MRKSLTIIYLLISFTALSQTAQDYLNSGIKKQKALDYKGAVGDFTKAINIDNNNRDAYYNRGTCEINLQSPKDAKADLDKAIELDPKFAKAYYSRATIFSTHQKYSAALDDLDKAIALDSTITGALTLRGQIRANGRNSKGACEDFHRAKQLGNENADRYIAMYCGFEQIARESLKLDWATNENWKVGYNTEDDKMILVEMIHSNETINNWTEMGNMMTAKGITNIPIDSDMMLMYRQVRKDAPKAKLTFIEKDELAQYPWIIFTIEAPKFKKANSPESQLWFIIQGKQSLYNSFWAIKQPSIPPDMKDKWIAFFKTGKVVMKNSP